ncbi:MAG TPA: cation:proton antiporter [Alphaproteobacteria bacterium]|nr:cation:proton antiporter [Alphaproteobacteria bacterium]
MPHQAELIATIAVSLGYALVGGFLATRFRLPAIVGYLLAGIAVGPFTPGFVADAHIAEQLAEIGVIMLMFGVGMHFSIQDLLAVKRIAVPGAIVQIVAITALGLGLAHFWGWSVGAGLVFGLALSIASTVVMLRAFDARDATHSPVGRLATGWLVVEDLVTVLVLVLLPALAPLARGQSAALPLPALLLTLALTLGKVALFIAAMLILGRRFFPWLLKQVADTGSRELFTLAVVAAAIGVAYASAELFDVSLALGAFFAGIVIGGSDLSYRAAADTQPIQDAFSVLFFVSVGMLLDPATLLRDPVRIVEVLAIVLLGKALFAAALMRAFRESAQSALAIAASLAQIGEFSFILAARGVALGLMPQAGQQLVIAAACLSITLNPLLFWIADRLVARRAPT